MLKNLLAAVGLLLLLNIESNAQAPESFNYQAVIRDNTGNLVINQEVNFRISILEGSDNGSIVYSEKHAINSNQNGLVNFQIGEGISLSGDFSTIDWGSDPHFVKVELDISGGTNYTELGVSKLNSVPYALYANNVNENNLLWSKKDNNIIYYDKGYVGIGTDNPDRSLEINIDTDGTNGLRSTLIMKNLDNSGSSIVDAVLKSGTDSNEAGGGIGVTALSYSQIADFAGYTYIQSVNSGVALKARDANGKLRFYTGGDDPIYERMTISNIGNVGISNNDPQYLLDIGGTINASEYLLDGSPISFNSPWLTNSSNLYYNGGFIGIGTDNPDRSLEINIDTDGTNGLRSTLIMKNLDNSGSSIVDAVLKSGTDSNEAGGGIGVTALSYSQIADFAGYTYLQSVNSGVALKARDANGKIRFYTGGDDPIYERMTISNIGNVGISNSEPKSKLQVSEGDVYIDQIGSGVIMKSPDGNCWRMTVDNTGNAVFSSITCPN